MEGSEGSVEGSAVLLLASVCRRLAAADDVQLDWPEWERLVGDARAAVRVFEEER